MRPFAALQHISALTESSFNRLPARSILCVTNMAIYNLHMAISVTKFKNSCLDVIRRVETTGQSVSITRRGKVVARLAPSFQATENAEAKPWQKLRALVANCWLNPENQSWTRRISRPCVDRPSRHAFLDLVAYAEISDEGLREKSARCRGGSWGVCLAAISLWEAQLLHSKQRLQLPIPFPIG